MGFSGPSLSTTGFATDVFDASDIAHCRMYRSGQQVIAGLLKNADEGIANSRLIFVFTILLAGAVVLPIPSLLIAIATRGSITSISLLTAASLLLFAPRMHGVIRFHHSRLGSPPSDRSRLVSHAAVVRLDSIATRSPSRMAWTDKLRGERGALPGLCDK